MKEFLYCNDHTMLWEKPFHIEGRTDILFVKGEDYQLSLNHEAKINAVHIPEVWGAGKSAEAVTHEMAHICFCIIGNMPTRLLKQNYGMSFQTTRKKADLSFLSKCFDNELKVAAIQMRIAMMAGYDIDDIMTSFDELINNIEQLPSFREHFNNEDSRVNIDACQKYFHEYSPEIVLKAWTDAINFLYERSIYA